MRLVIAAAFVLAIAACAPTSETSGKADEAGDTVVMSAETEDAPTAEPALAVASVPTGQYSAVSRTAASITGDLTLGDVALTFARGQTYQTQRVGVVEASHSFGAQTLAQLFSNISPTTGVEVRRVTSQDARNGSMCGRDAVTFVALAAATGSDGMPGLWIAAFKGANAPGEGATEADLCGTFSYAPSSL